jgi:hypothetical protein
VAVHQLIYQTPEPRRREPIDVGARRVAEWTASIVVGCTLAGAIVNVVSEFGSLAVLPVYFGGAVYIMARIVAEKGAGTRVKAGRGIAAIAAYLLVVPQLFDITQHLGDSTTFQQAMREWWNYNLWAQAAVASLVLVALFDSIVLVRRMVAARSRLRIK